MNYTLKLAGILVSIFCFTQNVSAQGHSSDGFYIGVDGSYDRLTDNSSINDASVPVDVINVWDPAAGVFIGYRQTKGKFNVAVEARYGYGFNKQTAPSGAVVKNTHEFELAALPGFWLTDEFLVYARLGVTNNSLRVTVGNNTITNTGTDFSYGAGAQLSLVNGFSIRGEYTRGEVYDEPISLVSFWRIKRDRFKIAILKKF